MPEILDKRGERWPWEIRLVHYLSHQMRVQTFPDRSLLVRSMETLTRSHRQNEAKVIRPTCGRDVWRLLKFTRALSVAPLRKSVRAGYLSTQPMSLGFAAGARSSACSSPLPR